MPRRERNGDGKMPFDADRPEYADLTVSVNTRFKERLENYAKHYEAEKGRKPDLGILLANIVGPALDTDTEFVKKERNGHFNSNGGGAASARPARAPREAGSPSGPSGS